MALEITAFLAVKQREETSALRLEAKGCVFRPPSLRDLAGLIGEGEDDAFALLRRCCMKGDLTHNDATELLDSAVVPWKRWLGLFEQVSSDRQVDCRLGQAAAGIGCSALMYV